MDVFFKIEGLDKIEAAVPADTVNLKPAREQATGLQQQKHSGRQVAALLTAAVAAAQRNGSI